jgi:hypothetical protein
LLVPFLLSHPTFFSMPFRTATKFLKAMHSFIRETLTFPMADGTFKTLTIEESRLLYGWDSLAGPSEKLEIDPTEEIRMRQAPGSLPAIPIFLPNIPQPLREPLVAFSVEQRTVLMSQAIRRTVNETLPDTISHAESFSQWYARRMAWSASGGAPGAKVKWSGGDSERLNKRGALLGITEHYLQNILRDPKVAILYSKASIKYEKGKCRAIWNTAIEHYLFQAYILEIFEGNATHSPSPYDGNSPVTWNSAVHTAPERLNAQAYRMAGLLSTHGLMWDYSDFNINHNQDDTIEMYHQTVDRITHMLDTTLPQRGEIISDLKECLEWISVAKTHTYLDNNDPNDSLVASVVRSLQSGERATSYTNTFMSRTYFHLMDLYCQQHLSIPSPILPGSFQQGDDVFALTANITDAQLACSLMNILGFAGQLHKITSDYGPRGEFLRLCYDGHERKVAGYPIRGGVGLISGEFFMDSVFDPDARAGAFYEAYQKANRRGSIIPKATLEYLVDRNCHVTYTAPSGVKRHVSPDLQYMMTPSHFGGLGVSGQSTFVLTAPELTYTDGEVIVINGYTSSLPRPVFQPPVKDARALTRASALVDTTTAVRLAELTNNAASAHELSRMLNTIATTAVKSGFTGAYPKGDVSQAIADYAKELYSFKAQLKHQKFELPSPPYLELFKQYLPPIVEAAIPPFTLAPTARSLTLAPAIAIPSGGGKTTLAGAHKDIFYDHDDFVDLEYVLEMVDKQDWRTLNLYHKLAHLPIDKVLLTWSPDTAPDTRAVAYISLVTNPSGIRANAANTAHLWADYPSHIAEFSTYEQQTSAALAIAGKLLEKRAFTEDQKSAQATLNPKIVHYPHKRPYLIRSYQFSKSALDAAHYGAGGISHQYGAVAALTAVLGFSMHEALLYAVSRQKPFELEGNPGRWLAMFHHARAIRQPNHHALRQATNRFTAFMCAGGDINLRLRYLLGDLQFLPPRHQRVSSDILVVARDITLHLLETKFSHLFNSSALHIISYVAAAEDEAVNFIVSQHSALSLGSIRFYD